MSEFLLVITQRKKRQARKIALQHYCLVPVQELVLTSFSIGRTVISKIYF